MESIVTARMDADLKERATKVMERRGYSSSQAIRELYSYIVRNDRLPFPQPEAPAHDDVAARVAAFDACVLKHPSRLDDMELKAQRLKERYGLDA
jgi:RHH-type transcriptional regulator, rel operon repressor / antitoxin RelB